MKTQHTPGPWKIERPIDKMDSNCAWILMLEALRAAEKWAMLTQTDPVPWLDDATFAIAKAEGREP
jgi:hypothetical protein